MNPEIVNLLSAIGNLAGQLVKLAVWCAFIGGAIGLGVLAYRWVAG